jgi:hypothetical protein
MRTRLSSEIARSTDDLARRERQLDDALAETFPASDPVSISSVDQGLASQRLIKPANEPH